MRYSDEDSFFSSMAPTPRKLGDRLCETPAHTRPHARAIRWMGACAQSLTTSLYLQTSLRSAFLCLENHSSHCLYDAWRMVACRIYSFKSCNHKSYNALKRRIRFSGLPHVTVSPSTRASNRASRSSESPVSGHQHFAGGWCHATKAYIQVWWYSACCYYSWYYHVSHY